MYLCHYVMYLSIHASMIINVSISFHMYALTKNIERLHGIDQQACSVPSIVEASSLRALTCKCLLSLGHRP